MSERATRDGENVAHVHERLRELILSDQLRGGHVVSQADLTERLASRRG